MLIDTHCHLNDPAYDATLPDVIARAISELRHMSYEEVCEATTANARRLFGLP